MIAWRKDLVEKQEEYDTLKKKYNELLKKHQNIISDYMKDSEIKEIMNSMSDIPHILTFWDTLIHGVKLSRADIPSTMKEALDIKQGQIMQLKQIREEINNLINRK